MVAAENSICHDLNRIQTDQGAMNTAPIEKPAGARRYWHAGRATPGGFWFIRKVCPWHNNSPGFRHLKWPKPERQGLRNAYLLPGEPAPKWRREGQSAVAASLCRRSPYPQALLDGGGKRSATPLWLGSAPAGRRFRLAGTTRSREKTKRCQAIALQISKAPSPLRSAGALHIPRRFWNIHIPQNGIPGTNLSDELGFPTIEHV